MSDPFSQLAPFVQEYIRRERWDELRPVQLAAIPAILETDDHVLLCSGTASGKTEAAFLPIITELLERPPNSVGVIYISPLKALINDQFQRLDGLLDDSDIPVQGWHGDVPQSTKQRFLRQGRGILQITPESLEAMLLRRHLELGRLFHDLRFVVLDEVHAFINSDRGRQVLCQLQRLELVQRQPPRRIGLSATVGEPERVGAWLAGSTDRKVSVIEEDAGRRRIYLGQEHFVYSEKEGNPDLFDDMAELVGLVPKTLIFVNTRADVEDVVYNLKRRQPVIGDTAVHAHHGSVSAPLREAAETEMRDGTQNSCIAATVTLELGIDIGTLDQVLQLNTTSSVSSLVQRLGRSGRRYNPPRMFLYSTEKESAPNAPAAQLIPWQMLQAIAIVQLFHEERWVEPPQPPSLPTSLLVQQTLSILASSGGLHPRVLASKVLTLTPFAAVSLDQFRDLLRHLLQREIIEQIDRGELLVAPAGERIVNDWHFYATFESRVEFGVRAGTRVIGSVQSPPPKGEVFLLAGRAWEVKEIDERRFIVFVKDARGRTPATWRGEGPPLHDRIAKRVRQVIAEDSQYPWLKSRARTRLASARKLARECHFHCRSLHDIGGGRCLLLPWSGTREINTLLRILAWGGFEVRESIRHYVLEISKGKDNVSRDITDLLNDLPDSQILAAAIPAAELPLGKFDRYTPESLLREAHAMDVLDVERARLVLEQAIARD